MKTVSVIHVTVSVILALFVLQVARRLLAKTTNPVAQGVEGGLSFLMSS